MLIVAVVGTAAPSVDVYPSLTRNTLTGVWEGLLGIGSSPTVFHIDIAPEDGASYLIEFHAGYTRGAVFRLQSCKVADGKVELIFSSREAGEWWIEGEGGAAEDRGIMNARIGKDSRQRADAGAVYLQKGAWTRGIGEASVLAAEQVADLRASRK
jgi:hypothetical protein